MQGEANDIIQRELQEGGLEGDEWEKLGFLRHMHSCSFMKIRGISLIVTCAQLIAGEACLRTRLVPK